ncbi:DUF924 family protein [Aquabacter cavernae]|uniref:DUF924 family protein n=1 Tax=Aquabacter cavernae TaxID=2496029 RepID=UPI000F8E1E39|nr:DUF924 family protein [Aquabacter cavernae]
MSTIPSPADIVAFWRAAGPEKWFSADPAFDCQVREALLPAHLDAVARGAGASPLPDYEDDAQGALALVLLLDQVPRNVFRGTPSAFASDEAARLVAERALAKGLDAQVEPALRGFLYLPFMHAEDIALQERCVGLYEALGATEELHYARIHRDIIARFGRFPHRNPILGRATSEAERQFLVEGGFSG